MVSPSVEPVTQWRRTPLNLLVSFPYCGAPLLMQLSKCPSDTRILVDSGAFTAWRSGKPISVPQYDAFLRALPITPWRVFTLDVIGDHQASMVNYLKLRDLGHKVVPIFTRGAPIEHLEVYYETSDLVAVGGLVGTQGNQGFVKGIMQRVGDRRVHWLGFTRQNFLRHFRPYSVDSSSWESGALYGQLKIYMGRGRFISVRKETFRTRPDPTIVSVVKSYGVSYLDLGRADAWKGGMSISRILGGASVVRYAMELERLGVTQLFAAFTTGYGLGRILIPVYQHEINTHQEAAA